VNLFRFEALGLLPKRDSRFKALDINGTFQLSLDQVSKLADDAVSVRLTFLSFGYNCLALAYRTSSELIYVFPDQRRAGPLWRKFQKGNTR
jgi:hypothetical protein